MDSTCVQNRGCHLQEENTQAEDITLSRGVRRIRLCYGHQLWRKVSHVPVGGGGETL